ncbi:MAG: endonuclease YncB(thermonuclease family) [Paracoccaceae bacterium]
MCATLHHVPDVVRFFLILSLLFAGAAWGRTVTGPVSVTDGDTLRVAGDRVRLYGVDAPEADQTCWRDGVSWACGLWATRQLREQIAGRIVTCDVIGTDRYDRLVAKCFVDGRDIAVDLVRRGVVTAYARYSQDYIALETQAVHEGVGLWASEFVRPAAWRRAASQGAANVSEGTCVIKGNISSGGRIFHMPGQTDYRRTRISKSKGERWFCSESDAVAAGWRKARR